MSSSSAKRRPAHIRDPWPKGSRLNGCIRALSSPSHLSGRNVSGSEKYFFKWHVTREFANTGTPAGTLYPDSTTSSGRILITPGTVGLSLKLSLMQARRYEQLVTSQLAAWSSSCSLSWMSLLQARWCRRKHRALVVWKKRKGRWHKSTVTESFWHYGFLFMY